MGDLEFRLNKGGNQAIDEELAFNAGKLKVDGYSVPSPRVHTQTAARVLTVADSGETLFLNSATEFQVTLPAPAAGLKFSFFVAAAPAGASYTIYSSGGSNIIVGHVVTSSDGAAEDSEAAGGDTISFADGVAVVGDRVDVICDGSKWYATAFCAAHGGVTITTAA